MAALLMFWGTFPGGGHLASDGLPAGANPGWPQIQLSGLLHFVMV